MWARVGCLFVCMFAVSCETVTKKFCDHVNPAECTVHSAAVDPCPKGINFCSLYRNKPYILSVDFTPTCHYSHPCVSCVSKHSLTTLTSGEGCGFSAQNLRLAMYGDDDNDGTFDKIVKTPADPCDLMTCPVSRDVPRFFNFHFTLDKTHGMAKFPVKFKLWNADDEAQACCFTFNVKVKK